MELLVVIGIVVLLAAMSVPAIRSLTKSNDQSQAVNLVRSMLDTARSIAVSQHRQAGVVFFEETTLYSRPVNANQTAMQVIVEDYDQAQYQPVLANFTVFVPYSPARQYMPAGVRVVTMQDLSGVASDMSQTGASSGNRRGRVVVFDANGQLLLRSGISSPLSQTAMSQPGQGPGKYPTSMGDWMFVSPAGQFPPTISSSAWSAVNSSGDRSAPGVFLFNQAEFDAQFPAGNNATDQARSQWLVSHADVVIVNANTGTVLTNAPVK